MGHFLLLVFLLQNYDLFFQLCKGYSHDYGSRPGELKQRGDPKRLKSCWLEPNKTGPKGLQRYQPPVWAKPDGGLFFRRASSEKETNIM